MRKFLPLVFGGLAALSYSQLGVTADADPGERPDAYSRGKASAPADDNAANVVKNPPPVVQGNRGKGPNAGARRGESSAGSSESGAGSSSSSGNNGRSMEKDDATSAAPGSSRTPGSTPKGTGY
jgi:hypothetical protein